MQLTWISTWLCISITTIFILLFSNFFYCIQVALTRFRAKLYANNSKKKKNTNKICYNKYASKQLIFVYKQLNCIWRIRNSGDGKQKYFCWQIHINWCELPVVIISITELISIHLYTRYCLYEVRHIPFFLLENALKKLLNTFSNFFFIWKYNPSSSSYTIGSIFKHIIDCVELYFTYIVL